MVSDLQRSPWAGRAPFVYPRFGVNDRCDYFDKDDETGFTKEFGLLRGWQRSAFLEYARAICSRNVARAEKLWKYLRHFTEESTKSTLELLKLLLGTQPHLYWPGTESEATNELVPD
jgi:hypothetical protein